MGTKQKRKLVEARAELWECKWTRAEKQRKLVIGCAENIQQQQDMLTQEFILKIKFDKEQNTDTCSHAVPSKPREDGENIGA